MPMEAQMRAARLHGLRDIRVETLEVPAPGRGELLVELEACGVCPTDARKYNIGVNDGTLPFNPGHEWIGRVAALGADVTGWQIGDRVAGDTYAGYAEYAVLPTAPSEAGFGALAISDDVPADRIVFLEPFSCALHALYDQAHLRSGQSVVIVGAGQMGLQLTAAAAQAGAVVHVIERREDRRLLAEELGATTTRDGDDAWPAAILDATEGRGADIVVISVGIASLIEPSIAATARGGSIVLFAGFGSEGVAQVDINALHYREISLVGATASGYTPAMQRLRFEQARDLLSGGSVPLERLVTGYCTLDDLPQVLDDVAAQRVLKTVLQLKGK